MISPHTITRLCDAGTRSKNTAWRLDFVQIVIRSAIGNLTISIELWGATATAYLYVLPNQEGVDPHIIRFPRDDA